MIDILIEIAFVSIPYAIAMRLNAMHAKKKMRFLEPTDIVRVFRGRP